ncbi:AzlD domain-containing protein [Pseudomaricurvus sp.]|uniref:AzlD domain-containing protein n=1 Tax=Pseudomaricurvus sp. TaxID=2004510 RepID=UPI003F6C9232
MMIWVMIGLMAAVTFYNRYAFFSPHLKFSIGSRLQSLLSYTAPAVLTALWVPIVFVQHTSAPNEKVLNLNFDNPYFTAGLITVAISALVRQPLVTVIAGVAVFVSLSQL